MDLSAKKQNAASNFVNAVDRMMKGLYDAAQVAREITSAGLTYDDADFGSTSALAHLTAAGLTNAIGNINTILADMEAESRDDVLNAVRP